MNGTKDLNKNAIEELIYKNGGKFIQNVGQDVIIIGSDDGELFVHTISTIILTHSAVYRQNSTLSTSSAAR